MPKDLNAQQVGAQKSNVNNEPKPSRIRGRHYYRYNYPMYTTQPFGIVQPYMYFHTVKNDDLSILSQHDLRTYEMRAPFMGNVIMNKMLVHVNMDAIYPRNWKLMAVPPVPTEDDVPDDIRALVNFQDLISGLLTNATRLINKLQQDTALSAERKRYIVKLFYLNIFALQDICSSGSLLSNLNIHIDRSVFNTSQGVSNPQVIDSFFDSFLSTPHNFVFQGSFTIDGVPYSTVSSDAENGYRVVTYREIYKLLFYSSYFTVDSVGSGFSNCFDSILFSLKSFYSLVSSELINIEPVIAYQLACAQFHTNSKIDPVFSAELWLNNMESMLFITGFDNLWFEKDGVYHRYDVFNARVFDYICNDWLGDAELFTDSRFEVVLFFLRNLFGFRKSLKYADYFTGASLRPYAGNDEDLQARVQQGSDGSTFVSAVDTTRSILYQRFLNKVNLVGSKLDDYLTKIFGGSRPEADSTVPQILAIETFTFGKDETTNTSTEQFKVSDGVPTLGFNGNITTSKLRGKDSFIRYNIYCNRPGIILGLCSFDIERVYSGTIDRFAFHYDRYDDFIPDLQFMGDQEVKLHEADFRISDDVPIGYQLRHAEYKQKYGYAAGGFNTNMLPGWAFIPDAVQMGSILNLPKPLTYSGIRNNPFDFDIFFPSLTGVSSGTYFHFIIRHGMNIEANRDIIPTPEILI